MNHPTQNDGRVHGVVVAIQRETDGRWLMIRRSEHVYMPLTVAFPGGGIEPGESFEEAAVREAKEELGLDVRLGERVWDWLSPDRPLRLVGFRGEVVGGELEPDPQEVAAVLWMTAAEAATDPDVLPGSMGFFEALGGV